jgi:hypothetical protein
MMLMMVTLVLSADPGSGPVNATPALLACSVETLRMSGRCIFDSHPARVEEDVERKKQSRANVELAMGLVRDLCARRAPDDLKPKPRIKRINGCVQLTMAAAATCSLDGVEALLDAEGRFSPYARACYQNLASAMQSADVRALESVRSDAAKAEPRRQSVDL